MSGFFTIISSNTKLYKITLFSASMNRDRSSKLVSLPTSAWTTVCPWAELKCVKVLLSAGQSPTTDVTNVFMHFHKCTNSITASGICPRTCAVRLLNLKKPPTRYSETSVLLLLTNTFQQLYTGRGEIKIRVQDCIQSTKSSSLPKKHCLSRSTNGYK